MRPHFFTLLPRAAATLGLAALMELGMTSVGRASPGLSVSDLNHGVTAANLANALAGSAVTVSNVTYTGDNRAAGAFSGGANIVGPADFDTGIILNSGKVQMVSGDPTCSVGVEGPNKCFEPTNDNDTEFLTPGDTDLTTLSGFTTFDAAVLEFDFVPQFSTVQFKYVFSSEEYSDYSNTEFNDVFGFFINGQNCALVPGTSEPVSVNTINNGNDVGGDPTSHHAELFRDNVNPSPTIDTEMDGLTVVLTCSASVNAGQTNHMKLAIADASDAALDSAVFLQAGSLTSGTVVTTSLTGGGQSGTAITVPQGTDVTDSATLSGTNIANAGGTVSYKVYSDPSCNTLFADAGTKNVTSGQVPDSDPVPLTQAGTFYWQASYSGDSLNDPGFSRCGDETVTVTPAGGSTTTTIITTTTVPTTTTIATTTTVTTTTTTTTTTSSTTTTTIPQNKCPRTQGFWKNHPAAWPVTSLTLGSQTYTQAELLTILNTPPGKAPKADASLILADQLIAAKLNIANGSDPTPVSSTIADADSLLAAFPGKLPYKVSVTSATGEAMINDANVLDSYNSGTLIPNCVP